VGGRDQNVGRLLVGAQFVLIGLIVVLPQGSAWSVSVGVARIAHVLAWVGILTMAVAALGLGRGLTAMPLPNDHAQLRTGGLYRLVRHPIYSGLLLFAVASTVPSGSLLTVTACALLVVLINGKARWEEQHLALRFPGYRDYAARTRRFIPVPRSARDHPLG